LGGAGFVGSHLTGAFLDAGHDVLVIDNLSHGLRDDVDGRARFYQVDIRDAQVQHILRQERPDVVSYHVAPRTSAFPGASPLIDADVEVRGLLNVLDGCVNASVARFIYASNGSTLYKPVSIAASVRSGLHIAREDTPVCPQHPGDICKLTGEWYVRHFSQAHGIEHIILRYAHIYGETRREQAQHPITHFIDMLARGQRPAMRGPAREVRDHIHIDDVVQANLRALERGRNCTLHISTGKGSTLDQLCKAVAAQLSSDLLPVSLVSTRIEPTALVLDNTLARQQLDWQPHIDLAEGVKRAVEALCGEMVPARITETPVREPVLSAVLAHA
jgi:UDP-glucose 4-epimerase